MKGRVDGGIVLRPRLFLSVGSTLQAIAALSLKIAAVFFAATRSRRQIALAFRSTDDGNPHPEINFAICLSSG